MERDSMVRSDTPEPADGNQTLGDLVNAAAKDVSQLIRYEIDLAKTELGGDLSGDGLAGPRPGRRRTRKSVTEGLGMLRRDPPPEVSSDGPPEVSGDGQRPEIAGRKP